MRALILFLYRLDKLNCTRYRSLSASPSKYILDLIKFTGGSFVKSKSFHSMFKFCECKGWQDRKRPLIHLELIHLFRCRKSPWYARGSGKT